MLKLLARYLAIIFVLFTNLVFAQDHKDCETALKICGESPFFIETSSEIGMEDPEINTSCILSEGNSTWIKWNVIVDGTLTFVLTPVEEFGDLDFLLFRYNTIDDCSDKEAIRCMASGENAGAPFEEWESCTGSTGLQMDETDVVEDVGCAKDDNNFLAPLDAKAGEQYVLVVNDFSNSQEGFNMSFGGDAVLDCITVPLSVDNDVTNSKIKLSPTISDGFVRLELINEQFIGAEGYVYNLSGQKVFDIGTLNSRNETLDVSLLSNGIYFLKIRKGKNAVVKKFVVQK